MSNAMSEKVFIGKVIRLASSEATTTDKAAIIIKRLKNNKKILITIDDIELQEIQENILYKVCKFTVAIEKKYIFRTILSGDIYSTKYIFIKYTKDIKEVSKIKCKICGDEGVTYGSYMQGYYNDFGYIHHKQRCPCTLNKEENQQVITESEE